MIVWPFKPREEVIEALEWRTDVLQSRGQEQRIALRSIPRRIFNLSHVMSDLTYSHAQALIRANQGGDGFYLPDWTQAVSVGPLEPDSAPHIAISETLDIGDYAVLWDSETNYELVSVEADSNGYLLDSISNTYTSAYFLPALIALNPEGISVDRGAGSQSLKTISMSLSFICAEERDIAATPAVIYRDLDLLDECPVVAGGEFEETLAWELSTFDNNQNSPEYIRKRNLPDMRYQMRWHEFTRSDKYALKQWLYYRRGRQKAFWMSSRAKDLEPTGDISGTTATIYALPELTGLGRDDAFDIEIKTPTDSFYRRVTSLTTGTPVGERETIDMTLDASVTASGIQRISFLRCTRFDSDRIELLHRASSGMAVSVNCIEVLEP